MLLTAMPEVGELPLRHESKSVFPPWKGPSGMPDLGRDSSLKAAKSDGIPSSVAQGGNSATDIVFFKMRTKQSVYQVKSRIRKMTSI